jgi:hypothetical protein
MVRLSQSRAMARCAIVFAAKSTMRNQQISLSASVAAYAPTSRHATWFDAWCRDDAS